MDLETLGKLFVTVQPYGFWGLVGITVVAIVWLLIRRGFSLTVQMDVGRRRS